MFKDEADFQEFLEDILTNAFDEERHDLNITTYQQAGLLTNDKGLIITTPDGQEYQITIKQRF